MEKEWPNDPGLLLSRAVLLGRTKKTDEALAMLDRMAEQSTDGKLGANELAEKGRLLDQMGRYDDAFVAFSEGKRIARELSGHAYLDAAAENLTTRLSNFFVSGRLQTLPRASTVRSDVPQPIFVLGLPPLRHHADGTDVVGASEKSSPVTNSR